MDLEILKKALAELEQKETEIKKILELLKDFPKKINSTTEEEINNYVKFITKINEELDNIDDTLSTNL